MTETPCDEFHADRSGARKAGQRIDFNRAVAQLDSIHGRFHALTLVGQKAKWPPKLLRELAGLVSDLETLASACDTANGARPVLHDLIVDAEVHLPPIFNAVAKEITRFLRGEFNGNTEYLGISRTYGKR
ncbi:MAG TPA: hypothetical protein VFC38_05660 [Stellaceae bacterium]|nr:hypothetical protein [Stellaceae bacterium]